MRAMRRGNFLMLYGLRQIETSKPQRTKDKALVHITAAA